MASESHVSIYCAQLMNELSGEGGWTILATADVKTYVPCVPKSLAPAKGLTAHFLLDSLTSSPISAITWVSRTLVAASGDHLCFYGPGLSTGRPYYDLVEEKVAPLPNHHPQVLYQALLYGQSLPESARDMFSSTHQLIPLGELSVVVRILTSLATQLTDDGDVTPFSRPHVQFSMSEFLGRIGTRNVSATLDDIIATLTNRNN